MRIPEKRIIELKEFIKNEGTVTVEKLSKKFSISPITVRRDLARLDDEGFLKKVHGGAIYSQALEPEPVFTEKVKQYKEEKSKIARMAASRIDDGDSIILESGSTCLGIVDYLKDKKNIRVSTAGIPIAYELWNMMAYKKDMEVEVCGGIVSLNANVYVGPHAVKYFESINADKAFVGAVAVSLDKGLSTATPFDSEISQAVFRSAREVILVCDSSKFNKYSYINVAPLTAIDEIITDDKIDRSVKEKIERSGVKITCV